MMKSTTATTTAAKATIQRALLLLVVVSCSLVSANKDDTYYANGVTNPNTINQKMYWHAGRNVLEDLSQFDKLYITYHNCAWETPTGDEEGGGGGGDNDDWYLGAVPSFQANVAFSLYGVLAGEKDTGCNKKTFINSFHTTRGVESFTNAVALAGYTNLFQYTNGEDDDDGNHEYPTITSTCNGDEDGDNDGDDNIGNGDKYDSSSTSYGAGCALSSSGKSKKFAILTYQGSYCDANAIVGTVDDLEDFNERLELSKCVPIYTNGDYYSGNGDNHDDEDTSPLAILEYARTCRLYDGTGGSCPDPYGKLKQYERALAEATGAIEPRPFWTAPRVMVTAWSMIALGIASTLAAIVILVMDCMGPKTVRRKMKRKKSKRKIKEHDYYPDNVYLEPSMTEDTQDSQLSEALGYATRLGRNVSRTLGLGERRASKKDKKEKSHKSKKKDKKSKSQRDLNKSSEDKPKSHKSLNKTTETGDKPKSHKSLNKTTEDKPKSHKNLNKTTEDKPKSQKSLNKTTEDKPKSQKSLNKANEDKPKSQKSLKSTEKRSSRSNRPDPEEEQSAPVSMSNRSSSYRSQQSYTNYSTTCTSLDEESRFTDGAVALGLMPQTSPTQEEEEQTETGTGMMDHTSSYYGEDEDQSGASASVQGVTDLVHVFKKDKDKEEEPENFKDEGDDYSAGSVKMKIPDELPQNLPHSPPTLKAPDETELTMSWTEQDEDTSKRKWRKRKWFRKLMGDK